MALYLGGEKVTLILDNAKCQLNLYSEKPITNGIILLSADGYMLKDLNGLYVTAKEDE